MVKKRKAPGNRKKTKRTIPSEKSRTARILAGIIFSLMLILLTWSWIGSNYILMPERDTLYVSPQKLGMKFELVKFHSTDGFLIHGFYIPCPKARGTIIVLHGQEDNKSEFLKIAEFLHRHGYNTLLFDFRAHGWTEGYCTLGALETRDLDGAINYLLSRPDIQKNKIGVIGFSMGGATAIVGAAKNKVIRAVVSDSAYINLNYVVPRHASIFYHIPYPGLIFPQIWMAELRAGFCADEANALRYIDQLSPRPVFLIGCNKDMRVPPENQKELFKKAKQPKQVWYVPKADHAEAYETQPREFERKVVQFFNRYIK